MLGHELLFKLAMIKRRFEQERWPSTQIDYYQPLRSTPRIASILAENDPFARD